MRPAKTHLKSSTEMLQLVVFRIAQLTFSVPITSVCEMLRPRPILVLPHSPKHILGAISLRQEAILVGNLASFFKLRGSLPTPHQMLIILDSALGSVAITADEIVDIQNHHFHNLPDYHRPSFLMGTYQHDKEIVGIINSDILARYLYRDSLI